MAASEEEGLSSASIFIMSGGVDISPATITFISVPDLDFTSTGIINLGGTADHFVGISKQIEFPWAIQGIFSSEFSSEWGVGQGGYNWYRVETSCGRVTCETTGLLHPDCKNMTITTVVAARNLEELCHTLKNPALNPVLDARIRSIKKYSRTPSRSATADECNVLEEQEFCQIAECLDYCLDEDVRQNLSFSMRAIESTKLVEMSGGVHLYGQVQTNKHKLYEPLFPVVGVSGSSTCKISLSANSFGGVSISGSAITVSSDYNFEASGSISIGGYARTCSPSRRYEDMVGGLELFGEPRFLYSPVPEGSISLSGSSETFFVFRPAASGKIEIGGRIMDYTSPKYLYRTVGLAEISGSASYNFDNIGIVPVLFGATMLAFDLASESSVPVQTSGLTISEASISPSCGCGPLALSLDLQHNLDKSSFVSGFLARSSKSLDDTFKLRYKSSDSSWRYSRSILGFGRDGVSREEMSIFVSLSCSSGFWKFSFSANTYNQSTNDRLSTKFILDMPSDLICSDGNISTKIELNVNSGEFQVSTGQMISVVEPFRTQPSNPRPRTVDVFVDGIFGDKRVYYDNIGLFKNSYWSSKPIKMLINPVRGVVMPQMDTSRIF